MPLTVGVYVDAHLEIADQARMIEDAGFSHLWVYDSPLVFAEPYMAMLEAARATERIVIGPGVTQPLARPPYATAQALATLSKAAPGRVICGMGIGNSARWSLGMKPATLNQMHHDIDVIRGLMAGRTVALREGDRERPIRFIHPEGRWIDISHPVEIWVSAFGPRGQALAGRNTDAIFIRWEGPEALEAARARFHHAARRAGRDPERLKIAVVYAVYPVEDESELDSAEARAALGPLVISRARYLTANHSNPAEVPEHFRPGFETYMQHRQSLDEETRHLDNYDGYLVTVPPYLEGFVTPESIRTVVHVGDSQSVLAEMQRMADAGVDHASLQIAGPPPSWCERMAPLVASVSIPLPTSI
jgi:alkanesulfonate monooxygenase SsuD/methylene tetrahydromethanopterin reductase-like flavin-dependent oxidoreductase (luciferase family)